jgi:phosphatidylinositol-3-phosphatase
MRRPLLSILLATMVLVSSAFANATLTLNNSGTVTNGSPLGKLFDYVVVILMENHGVNVTYGTSCVGNCTFFNYHANASSFAENYDDGGVSGSLGDYIALTSGDGAESCNSAPGNCGPFNDLNIIDRIEVAHLSWKAYTEDYPFSCGGNCSPGSCFIGGSSSTGHYTSNHNPFVYYKDILNSPSRCSRITPANSIIPTQVGCGNSTNPGTVENDDLLLGDLNSLPRAANYTFLTPNSIDDIHDCLSPPIGDVSIGNRYLQQLVPQILNSVVFRTKRAALFITFDEPDPFVGSCPPPNNCSHSVYAVWASYNSAYTRSAFRSIVHFNHYSALRTIEDNWGFPPLNSTDASATNMNEFFK